MSYCMSALRILGSPSTSRALSQKCIRGLASSKNSFNVSLLGAGGAIGQSLALLMKYNPLISNLKLQDLKDITGLGEDLSHIELGGEVQTFHGASSVKEATTGSDIIVISAGLPRKPNMTREDLFKVNADILWSILTEIELKNSTIIALITNPVNSLVPVISQYFSKTKENRDKSIYGITTLDVVRANTYYSKHIGEDQRFIEVPVIGGHSGKTIVPLFFQANVPLAEKNYYKELAHLVQTGGDRVVAAKKGQGSASLSMAYAANRFVYSLINALNGEDVQECAYVKSNLVEGVDFFAQELKLKRDGYETVTKISDISTEENELLKEAIPALKKDIELGYSYAKAMLSK